MAAPYSRSNPSKGTGPTSGSSQFETWRIDLPRGSSRGEVRRLLTEHAEYGRWELWRLRLFPDGRRRIWLRRRSIRVQRG